MLRGKTVDAQMNLLTERGLRDRFNQMKKDKALNKKLIALLDKDGNGNIDAGEFDHGIEKIIHDNPDGIPLEISNNLLLTALESALSVSAGDLNTKARQEFLTQQAAEWDNVHKAGNQELSKKSTDGRKMQIFFLIGGVSFLIWLTSDKIKELLVTPDSSSLQPSNGTLMVENCEATITPNSLAEQALVNVGCPANVIQQVRNNKTWHKCASSAGVGDIVQIKGNNDGYGQVSPSSVGCTLTKKK